MKLELLEIVPDITDQYSSTKVDTSYLNTKVRIQHAFQIALVDKIINQFSKPVVVDIGDSAGTHIQYILGLYANAMEIKGLSVNLDINAISRIKEKNLEAIHARAEELHKYDINADIFLCFETLEHIMNPFQFLYDLSNKTKAKFLIITVPYLKKSRVGLHHIRHNKTHLVNAENTHIFEFCPNDWRLVAKHAGWEIVEETIYYQYPRKSILYFTKILWKRLDFEGFYGLILKRNDCWSSKYTDW